KGERIQRHSQLCIGLARVVRAAGFTATMEARMKLSHDRADLAATTSTTRSLIDISVVHTGAKSYEAMSQTAALRQRANIKKMKYAVGAEHQGAAFVPFIMSANC